MKNYALCHGVFLLLMAWRCCIAAADELSAHNQTSTITHTPSDIISIHHSEAEPAHAVLFPFVCLGLGILVYFLLSRCLPILPYTAVMFLVGTLLGVGNARLDLDNQLSDTIQNWWIKIDKEVLLVVFLPGLVYQDAVKLDVHLFQRAFLQCFNFAFPMVLACTILTALVTQYVFDYENWTFFLSLTLGAIISATDPVAVSTLMQQVGAPPRLQVHVAGESLLNDGSSIVFYTIFSEIFFQQLGVPSFGKDHGWVSGTVTFIQMSLGGAVVGVAFALAQLLLLYLLQRRLNQHENVVQVATSVAVTWLSYYVAEVVFHTSGIISTVTMGIVTHALGSALWNDITVYEDFWALVEYILNTVLFTLGGLVWGSIIANHSSDGSIENEEMHFTGKDWGYVFVLYILVTLIRFLVFGLAYPITSRIGIGTNWRESVFHAFGGLRGSIAIALVLALDNHVETATAEYGLDSKYKVMTTKVFGLVGGYAFITLILNGTLAASLLKKLGLASRSEDRERILHVYKKDCRQYLIDEMIELLSQKRFQFVNYNVIRFHINALGNLSKYELLKAVQHYEKTYGHNEDYRKPNLSEIVPFLPESSHSHTDYESSNGSGYSNFDHKSIDEELQKYTFNSSDDSEDPSDKREHQFLSAPKARTNKKSSAPEANIDSLSIKEMRLLFLQLLSSAYSRQMEKGELSDHREYIAYCLTHSVETTIDEVTNGKKLNDWHHAINSDPLIFKTAKRLKSTPIIGRIVKAIRKNTPTSWAVTGMQLDIARCMSFIHAHQEAEKLLHEHFVGSDDLSKVQEQVLNESKEQSKAANDHIMSFDDKDRQQVVGHQFCFILLNKMAKYVTKIQKKGLLQPTEAKEFIGDVQDSIDNLVNCKKCHNGGKKSN